MNSQAPAEPAAQAQRVEKQEHLSDREGRTQVSEMIQQKYTAPA